MHFLILCTWTWGEVLFINCFWYFFIFICTSFECLISKQQLIIIIIIMNISPRKLIQEPQMRSCSSQLSNKNVLSSFRNESKLKDGYFILAGRSFQIAGPQTLNDLGRNVTVLVLGMYSCPEVPDRNCLRPGIAETTMQSAAEVSIGANNVKYDCETK